MSNWRDTVKGLILVAAIIMILASVISGISSLVVSLPLWLEFAIIGIVLLAIYWLLND
jgi:Flp pilus assembly protein TadB